MNYLLMITLGFVTAHCLGEYFVCKDGSISQSKNKCIDLDKKWSINFTQFCFLFPFFLVALPMQISLADWL
ncbi:TPA: hypothetical protein JBH43_12915 [Legionella pneumophila]|nr:hypothetical protein [Legionella pneumophila]